MSGNGSAKFGGSFGGSFGGGYGGAAAQPAVQPAAPAASPASAAPVEGLVKETTTKDFVKDVLEESKTQPVLVDFWAPWCGPCKQLTPVIEKVVNAFKGKVKLVKMNIDDHPQVAGQLGIQSIPAVIAFDKGQAIDGFMGALPEGQVSAFIEKLVGSKAGADMAEVITQADGLLAEGNLAGAAEIYAQVLSVEPDNLGALGGLARAAVEAGDLEQAKAVLAQVPENKLNDKAVAAAKAALELAEQAAELGPIQEFEDKIAKNPADHQARFDLAVALNAAGKRDEAADHLLEIFKRDRAWNDDGARKQLVQFFEAWGPMDEATLAGRRKLSSLLFR
ncbi:thioredoxin [Phreatobacter stygius]|uniref:Thioredoxin n=1 Tax=Phreatobacter stygius TaxID=1940610 RepID=A0A4D7ASN0_9HYPH|nr:thioredoxin [Phreatobacter stygius]QCI64494.1 thioredoxin [Phreatobacter stygius]